MGWAEWIGGGHWWWAVSGGGHCWWQLPMLGAVAHRTGSGWVVDGSWMLLQVEWALVNVGDIAGVLYILQHWASKQGYEGGSLLTRSCVGAGRIGVSLVVGACHPWWCGSCSACCMAFSKGGRWQGRGLLTGSQGGAARMGSGSEMGACHLNVVVAVCSMSFSEWHGGMGVAPHLGCVLIIGEWLLLSTGGQCGHCWWWKLVYAIYLNFNDAKGLFCHLMICLLWWGVIHN